MKQFSATIVRNESICYGYYEMEFTWDAGVSRPEPGQFFTVRASDSTVPLLRRPFAFSAYDEKSSTASMIYQKRGAGTALLAAKERSGTIDIIGPLGKPFLMPHKDRKSLLIAGGIGLGPLLFLGRMLNGASLPFTLLFGCRTAANVPASDEFTGLRPTICTDDGTSGFKGTVIDYCETITDRIDSSTVIYACGPHPMLKGCHAFAQEKNAVCYVSVEQIMACGVGACMGCVVKVNREPGFARACVDGPVFNSSEIAWE